MRVSQRVRDGAATLVVAGLIGGAAAAQEPLTEETYGETMTEVRFLVGDSAQYIDSSYWPELGEALDTLFPLFQRIETFWTERGNAGAAAIAADAIAAVQEIGQAGVAMNQGQARAGVQTLRATCAACHEAHREPDGDGYQIKAGS